MTAARCSVCGVEATGSPAVIRHTVNCSENEPAVERHSVVYHVYLPGHETTHWAHVRVEVGNDYTELEHWRTGDIVHRSGPYNLSDEDDRKRWESSREVWAWLAEWELVELKPIGPEDSEYFATPKLHELGR